MLDRRRNGHSEQTCQLAHRGRGLSQALDDGTPVCIRKRVEHPISGRALVKHTLNLIRDDQSVK
jgi:hypothetical protein